MDFRQIRQFLAVAETLSFRKAAERLHMAQPPLSVAIRHLEEEIGGALFLRDRTGAKLTPLGSAVLEDARRIVFHAEQMRKTARASVAGISGNLRIGFIGSATYSLLPRVLPAFRRRYPNITLELREGSTSGILADVEAGTIDLGLIWYPVIERFGVTLAPVEWSMLELITPIDSELCKRKHLALGDLADQPFILYSPTTVSNLHGQVMLACQAAGFTPKVVQEAVQVQTLISLVESGLGIALVPSVSRRYGSDKVAFHELSDFRDHLSVAIALASRGQDEPAVAMRFREMLAEFYPFERAIHSSEPSFSG